MLVFLEPALVDFDHSVFDRRWGVDLLDHLSAFVDPACHQILFHLEF